jgi:protein SCO1
MRVGISSVALKSPCTFPPRIVSGWCRQLYVRTPFSKRSAATTAVLFALLALAGAAGCNRVATEERATAAGASPALTAAKLTDQDGRAVSFADFSGKTVIFSVFFSSCPSVCPRETQALSRLQQQLSPALKSRVRFVSLSVDPENDTPEAMRKFALANGADLNGWSFVRASAPATRALTQELTTFVTPANTQAEPSRHTTAVYLFDGSQRLMQRYAGSPIDVLRLAHEVEALDAWFQKKSKT